MKGLRNLKYIPVMLLGMLTKLAFTDQRHAKLDDFAEQMLKDFMHLFCWKMTLVKKFCNVLHNVTNDSASQEISTHKPLSMSKAIFTSISCFMVCN